MTPPTRQLRTRKARIRAVLISAAAVFALVNVGSGLLRGQEEAPRQGATDAEIEEYLTEQVRDAGYPGAAFAIVRDGRVTRAGGIGRADPTGRPIDADTPFVIGSLSKAITAAAVMQLVERGQVDLDASVTKYLPSFAVAGGRADEIALRHLLTQTSGLPSQAGSAPLGDDVTSLAAQVRALRNVSLASEPGAAFAYSNANYEVLGAVVEEVTGKTFGAYVADAIYAPLRMEHSHTELDEAQADGLSAAHRFWFGVPSAGTPFWRPDFLPAGWLIASAADLGRWAAANLEGGTLDGQHVLSVAAMEQMHAGAVDAGRSRYGMGWFDGRIGTTRTVSHSGSTTDMGSAIYLAPEQGVGVVVLFNGQSLLYEMLHKPEAIAEGAMARLVGEPAGGTLMALYPVFTLGVLAMVALQLRSLWRAAAHARRGEPATRPVLGSRRLGIGLAGWGRFVVPALILTSASDTFGAPWDILVQIDVGQALFAYAVLQLLIGAVGIGPQVVRLVGRLPVLPVRAVGAPA